MTRRDESPRLTRFFETRYQNVNSRWSRDCPVSPSRSRSKIPGLFELTRRWVYSASSTVSRTSCSISKSVFALPASVTTRMRSWRTAIVAHVEGGALLGVAQDVIRLGDLAEARRVAGFLVIGMEALRQQTVDPVDRVRIGVRADLQHLVEIVQAFFVDHAGKPLGSVIGARGPDTSDGDDGRRERLNRPDASALLPRRQRTPAVTVSATLPFARGARDENSARESARTRRPVET